MFNLVNDIVTKIQNENPLILNITNHVTIDFIANGLLSVGASPIMSFSTKEIDDLVKLSNVIVINLGTLDDDFNQLCHSVCEAANQYGKPVIFDPVGAGASMYRTETCSSLLKNFQISVIRANAGEIMALAGFHSNSKGVDSHACSQDAITHAELLSSQYNLTVCMSGKIDVIVRKNQNIKFARGSTLMPKVTGTGCLLTAIVGAFHAVHANSFEAASAASLFYAVCGEIAEKKSLGPASFKTHFLDTLSHHPEERFYV